MTKRRWNIDKLIWIGQLFVIIISFLASIINDWSFYCKKYDHKFTSNLYNNSQYNKGLDATAGIGDDALYAFSGYYYITGGDPSQVNFEHPPLGKYLIGLSIVIFGNENVIYLIYALLTLFFTYKIAFQLFGRKNIALFSIVLLSQSNFFKAQYLRTAANQYSISMLDLPSTLFFITGVYFLISKTKYKYYLFGLFWGLAFSTKFFPIIVLLIPLTFIHSVIKERQAIFLWGKSSALIFLVYVFTYLIYFIYHPSLIEFVAYQKYLLGWRIGNPVVLGNIFRTIYTGKYINWWNGGTVFDWEWSWQLPVILTCGLIGGLISLFRKEKAGGFIFLLCLVYLVYLTVGTVGITRYLLPIYPLLIILSLRIIRPLRYNS